MVASKKCVEFCNLEASDNSKYISVLIQYNSKYIYACKNPFLSAVNDQQLFQYMKNEKEHA